MPHPSGICGAIDGPCRPPASFRRGGWRSVEAPGGWPESDGPLQNQSNTFLKAVRVMWAKFMAIGLLILAVEPLASAPATSVQLRLVGSFAVGRGGGGGISAYKNLAFITMPPAGGSGGGVAIVDISKPSAPVLVGQLATTVAEEHRALRIGHRDVFVVLQLGNLWGGVEDHTGLKLYDIGDPANPQLIGSHDVLWGGAHFDIARQGNRTFALLSVIDSEPWTSHYGNQPGLGDLVIVDISDPANPVRVGEWGVIDEPLLGLDVYLNEQRGTQTRDFAEGVWASPDGMRAYCAYSDFGVMILDISDPSHPRFVGRAKYEADEQGEAFDVRTAKGGTVLVRSSLVRWPFRTDLASNVFPDVRSAGEDGNTPAVYALPDRRLAGDVVPVGPGCARDSYLADPTGRIALIEDEGTCSQALKAIVAQDSGAIGVILYKPDSPGGFSDSHGRPATAGRLTLPDGTYDPVEIPVVAVGTNTGRCLAQVMDSGGNLLATDCAKLSPVTIEATAVFSGYGRLDIFDTSTPSAPVKLGTFSAPNTMDVDYALAQRYPPSSPTRDATANHVEVSGSLIYAGWWAEGLRVIDISKASAPREIASWTGQGASPGDEPLSAWEVVRHNGLILLGAYNHGMYILKDVR